MTERTTLHRPSPPETRSGRPLLRLAAGVLAMVLIGLGVWAIVAADQRHDLATARQITDDWLAGWTDNDPEAVAAVFTEDGVFVDLGEGDIYAGKQAIADYAADASWAVSEGRRVTEGVRTDTGTVVFAIEFRLVGISRAEDLEIELDGELASRIEFLVEGRNHLAIARGLVDDFIAGLNDNDPEALASVFTGSGVYTVGDGENVVTGRDAIEEFAADYVEDIADVRRLDDGTISDTGTYVFSIRDEVLGESHDGRLEIRLYPGLELASWMEFHET